jgi:acyl carrier protein
MKNKKYISDIEFILKNNFNIKKKITKDTDITKFKNWDSLKHLDFIMTLEKKSKYKFSINEGFNLKKIKDFLVVLNKK